MLISILAWIVFGAIAGWVASIIMKTSGGLMTDIVVGIIGAIIGGFVFNTFGGTGVTGFNLYSLLVAIVGAIILLGIIKALRRT